MCGGAGARLWPLSRAHLAKPFVRLPEGGSLINDLLQSLPAVKPDEVLLVTSADHVAHCQAAAAKVPDLPRFSLAIEPCGRNTAAVVATACRMLRARHGDDVCLLILPADHHIPDRKTFNEALLHAAELARADKRIIALGVKPVRPATGYGYLHAGAEREGWLEVQSYKEKPPLAEAERMLAAGDYLWNAGVFVATAGTLAAEFEAHAPEIAAAAAALEPAPPPTGNWRPEEKGYAAYPALSFDRAVAERSDCMGTVPVDCGWSDLGTWDDWLRLLKPDAQGNRSSGYEIVLEDTKDVSVLSTGGRLVAVAGCQDVIVIDTSDAILVTGRDRQDAVRAVQHGLVERQHSTSEHPPAEERPWGRYRLLGHGPGWQAKSIEVEPGQRLSLQSHEHRAERWTVVRGRIQAIIGDKTVELTQGETCFIPQGEKHRMINPGEELAELVEVRFGSYLAENDIIRYEDDYARES